MSYRNIGGVSIIYFIEVTVVHGMKRSEVNRTKGQKGNDDPIVCFGIRDFER